MEEEIEETIDKLLLSTSGSKFLLREPGPVLHKTPEFAIVKTLERHVMNALVLASSHQSHVGVGVSAGALVYEALLLLRCLAGNMSNGGSGTMLLWEPCECNCFAPNKSAPCSLNFRAALKHYHSFNGH